LLTALARPGGEIDPEHPHPKAPWRAREIYEDAHDLAVAVIQRRANEWMRRTLQQALADQSKLLFTANDKRRVLQFAARFVEERVASQVVSRRNADLDRVLYPKNRRWLRDGDSLERVFRVKYILAMKKCLAEAEESIANGSSVDTRAQETRGLRPPPLNRATAKTPSPAPLPADPVLLDALRFLARLKWHPRFGKIVKAWTNSWQTGFRELAETVNDSFKSNARLTDRLKDEPLLIWPFTLAVQQTIDKLDVAKKDAVFQYASRFATTVKTPLEEALQILGNITTFLTIFPGPTAPAGVVADAIVQGASAAVSFMRQMDQDDAEAVSLFEMEADRLSQGGRYFDPLVQAAGAVAAAAAVPGALKSVLKFDKGGRSSPGVENTRR